MKQRGRPPAAALDLVSLPASQVLDRVPRRKPPHDLTDEEVEVWHAVVNSEPADWFTTATVPILAQYCRHVVGLRRIGELIEKATSDPDLSVKDYDRLLRMQDREGRSMTFMATKMRLTHQSILSQHGNKKKQSVRKPWET